MSQRLLLRTDVRSDQRVLRLPVRDKRTGPKLGPVPVLLRSLPLLLAAYVLGEVVMLWSSWSWAFAQAGKPSYESNGLVVVLAAVVVFGGSLVALAASVLTRSRAAKLREQAYPAAVDAASILLVVLSLAAIVFLYAAQH